MTVCRHPRHPHRPLPRHRHRGREGGSRRPLRRPDGRLDFSVRRLRWSRRVPVETHLANVGSHSLFLVHDEEAKAAFFAEERGYLMRAFPDGAVEQVYDIDLLLAATS